MNNSDLKLSQAGFTGQRDGGHNYLGMTRSTCPVCLKIVNAQIIMRDNKLYFRKFCPAHGHSEVKIQGDAQWALEAMRIGKGGAFPKAIHGKVEKGCPDDCGICPDHQQHTCIPEIDITDFCNTSCPICFADSKNQYHVSIDAFTKMISHLKTFEESPEMIFLNGGEVTLHPELFKLIDIAKSMIPTLQFPVVQTNGIRIGEDEDFVKKLKDHGAVIYLSFDGFSPEVYLKIRNKDLHSVKMKALANLEKYSIPYILVPVLMKGVNEGEIDKLIQHMLKSRACSCVSIQPVFYTGRGSDTKDVNLDDRITTSDALDIIETQTKGFLKKSDFFAIPCHHAFCGAATYILLNDKLESIPISRLVNVHDYLDLFKNRARVNADLFTVGLKPILEDIWSCSTYVNVPKETIKNLIETINSLKGQDQIEVEKRVVKQVSVHSFMDRHTYDVSRVQKCCIHYIMPNGQTIPFCNYNLFYRNQVNVGMF